MGPRCVEVMFFLTEIDPRAASKGSRDALGFTPIWARFGREVVGNLTTVTSSLRGFTTLLLGLYFADRAVASPRTSEEDRSNLFLKFEQLAAYSRLALSRENGDASVILGSVRATRRLRDNGHSVPISASVDGQILSNQRTNGLWGLYTVAARESGMVERDEHTLTPWAQKLVESEYLPRLSYTGSKDGAQVLGFLAKESSAFEPKGAHRQLAKALAAILSAKLGRSEGRFYEQGFVRGEADGFNTTFGRQAALWEILVEMNDGGVFAWETPFGFEELREAHKQVESRGNETLASALEHIEVLEPFFVAMAELFGYVIRQSDRRLSDIEKDVRSAWGKRLSHLKPARVEALGERIASASSPEAADRIVRMVASLHEGDYRDAMRLGIEHNAEVMKVRGGAPWVVEEDGRLRVRLREEGAGLSDKSDLRVAWYNSYFINSLKTVGAFVHKAVH